ncbi:succinoglycan biosynthesis protein exoM [Vibrio astriarenae]|nr:succinoglycan biosynthesis protein exoM [Vibrio sp. C7]
MKVNLCVCTFRRGSLSDTLFSIEKMFVPEDIELSVIIADNDISPSAQQRVKAFCAQSDLAIRYVHAPKQNISIARNACLELCDGDWIGFIDDDETIDKHWLEAMYTAILDSEHGIFLGPVEAIYSPNEHRQWMPKGAFHDTKPTFRDGKICSGYTCNVLIRYNDTQVKSIRFDERFGKTGGEDTLFLEQLQTLGLSMTYVENARVREPVPTQRSSLKWLMQRRFRFGQTHARVLLEQNTSVYARIKHIASAIIKAAYCYSGALLTCFNAIKWRQWSIRGALHIGVIARMIKNKDIELYGKA